jgi:ribosomal protein S18 acetylase RimI-like enzyme
MLLTHRPVATHDIPILCGFPQSAEELFFLFPRATFPLSPAQVRQAIAQRSDSTVVELDGAVVAFANFYRWETGGRCAIGNVMVSPAARGRGVGRYLVEQMIDLACTKHAATEVTVSCFNQNVAGLLFYTTLGFTPYAIEARLDPRDERVALLHLRYVRP